MVKFVLKCPNCQEEFNYNFLGKGATEGSCKKCGANYTITTRLTIFIFELLLFYIYVNQIQSNLLADAAIPLILIGMIAFCGGISLLLFIILNKFIGTEFLFEVQLKKEATKKTSK